MESRVVEAVEGWSWFVCGWRLFVQSPGMQVGYLLMFIVIMLLLGVIPFLGSLVLALVTPVLIGGWFHAVDKLRAGGKLELGSLFAGFQDKSILNPLLALGVVMVAVEAVTGIVLMLLLGDVLTSGLSPDMVQGMPALAAGGGMIFWMLVMLAIWVIALAALFYAIPLVVFRQAAPLQALRSSIRAGTRNIAPMTVFGVVYLVFTMLAAIPFGLGFLVLLPVSLCAALCSFRSVYPEQEEVDSRRRTAT